MVHTTRTGCPCECPVTSRHITCFICHSKAFSHLYHKHKQAITYCQFQMFVSNQKGILLQVFQINHAFSIALHTQGEAVFVFIISLAQQLLEALWIKSMLSLQRYCIIWMPTQSFVVFRKMNSEFHPGQNWCVTKYSAPNEQRHSYSMQFWRPAGANHWPSVVYTTEI